MQSARRRGTSGGGGAYFRACCKTAPIGADLASCYWLCYWLLAVATHHPPGQLFTRCFHRVQNNLFSTLKSMLKATMAFLFVLTGKQMVPSLKHSLLIASSAICFPSSRRSYLGTPSPRPIAYWVLPPSRLSVV